MNIMPYIQPAVEFIHNNPHSVNFILYLLAFFECVTVIGAIVPGTIVMSIIGVLLGSSIIPFGTSFFWIILGAFSGDYVGYLIGLHYKKRLHKIWPFTKHPKLLQKSENFFAKHGGKSIFIGRFLLTLRPMVPMVAGIFKMSQPKFLLAAIPSVIMWAVMYLTPGIILGALSLELPPKLATEFVLCVLLVIVIIYCISWLIKHFAHKIFTLVGKRTQKLWFFLKHHKTFNLFAKLIEDPGEPNSQKQLMLILSMILFLFLFFFLFWQVLIHGFATAFNYSIYSFLSSFRTPSLDAIMIAVTSFGEDKVILVSGMIFLVWLVANRYWYTAIHWLFLLLVAAGTIFSFKNIMFFPRPGGALNFLQDTSSFPSGHTGLVVAFFGFFSVLIARELPAVKRNLPYLLASIIAICVAFSRLYLGAHWLTDVLGSICIVLVIVLLFTISYRRKSTVNLPYKKAVLVFIASVFFSWLIFMLMNFHAQFYNYRLKWIEQSASFSDLKNEKVNFMPIYRTNRLGKPAEVFNILWLGDLNSILSNLEKEQWVLQSPQFDFSGFVSRIAGEDQTSHLPLISHLYHNKPPAVIMTKGTDIADTILILYLWESDITITDERNMPLWLGIIRYHKLEPLSYRLYAKKNKAAFMSASEKLFGNLHDFQYKKIIYVKEQQPNEIKPLNWDGVVFLISPKTYKLVNTTSKSH